MLTDEEILTMIRKAFGPVEHKRSERMDSLSRGVPFVIRYLMENDDQEVTAGDLSSALDVSSARMASILNVLESTGSIKKYKSMSDKRVTVVRLTPKGRQEGERNQTEFVASMRKVIEEIGIEEFTHYLQTTDRIRSILCEFKKSNPVR